MNLLEIRTLARKKLGETTAAFWTDTEINTYINLGCSDIAERTQCLVKHGYISTTAVIQNTTATIESQWTASVEFEKFLGIKDVLFHQDGENWQRMIPKFRTDLDAEFDGWRDAVGIFDANNLIYNKNAIPATPLWYWWDFQEDLIGIYPPCDASNATTNNLHVIYFHDHTDITADIDVPTIPKKLHLAIVEFAVATGFETRGLQDKANDAWSKFFKRLEEYHINNLKGREDDDYVTKTSRSIRYGSY